MSIQTRVRHGCVFLPSRALTVLLFFLVSSTSLCLDRRMFLMGGLQVISGKERKLTTDLEGLERMAYSMVDFVRRVFMDGLTGSDRLVRIPVFGSVHSLTCALDYMRVGGGRSNILLPVKRTICRASSYELQDEIPEKPLPRIARQSSI